MQFYIIAAVDEDGGIGKDGTIPWSESDSPAVHEDRREFARLTRGGVVIMGRCTWESLPNRPLTGRFNIVVSGSSLQGVDAVVPDFASALEAAWACERRPVFAIGGERIYREALAHPLAVACRVTRIAGKWNCDRFFPRIGREWVSTDGVVYKRVNTEETAYLDLLRELQLVPTRPNRTGIPTHSVFTRVLRFELVDQLGRRVLPLLTTKRVTFRIVAEELLWFIRGSWDARELQSKNVHIWDGNSSRAYLDSIGLTRYREGEVGAIYGMQWRHWGDVYTPECDRAPNHKFGGIDQLQTIVDSLKRDPWSRRHVMTAWNVSELSKMALQPCHVQYQFYVDPDENASPYWLSCHMTQRSGDQFLGEPVNICSVALLTHMIAEVCGLRAREIAISVVDCHLYHNHMEAVSEQISRTPRGFPHLEFANRVYDRKRTGTLTIDDWAIDDFTVKDYYPHPAIKAPMAV